VLESGGEERYGTSKLIQKTVKEFNLTDGFLPKNIYKLKNNLIVDVKVLLKSLRTRFRSQGYVFRLDETKQFYTYTLGTTILITTITSLLSILLLEYTFNIPLGILWLLAFALTALNIAVFTSVPVSDRPQDPWMVGGLSALRDLSKVHNGDESAGAGVEEVFLSWHQGGTDVPVRETVGSIAAVLSKHVGVCVDLFKLGAFADKRAVLKKAAEESKVVVVFLTPAYIDDANCCMELLAALKEPSKIVLHIASVDAEGRVLAVARHLRTKVSWVTQNYGEVLDALNCILERSTIEDFAWWQQQRKNVSSSSTADDSTAAASSIQVLPDKVPGYLIRPLFTTLPWRHHVIEPKKVQRDLGVTARKVQYLKVGPVWIDGDLKRAGTGAKAIPWQVAISVLCILLPLLEIVHFASLATTTFIVTSVWAVLISGLVLALNYPVLKYFVDTRTSIPESLRPLLATQAFAPKAHAPQRRQTLCAYLGTECFEKNEFAWRGQQQDTGAAGSSSSASQQLLDDGSQFAKKFDGIPYVPPRDPRGDYEAFKRTVPGVGGIPPVRVAVNGDLSRPETAALETFLDGLGFLHKPASTTTSPLVIDVRIIDSAHTLADTYAKVQAGELVVGPGTVLLGVDVKTWLVPYLLDDDSWKGRLELVPTLTGSVVQSDESSVVVYEDGDRASMDALHWAKQLLVDGRLIFGDLYSDLLADQVMSRIGKAIVAVLESVDPTQLAGDNVEDAGFTLPRGWTIAEDVVGKRFTVPWPYCPRSATELKLHVNDEVVVLAVWKDGSAMGVNTATGKRGLFPLSCLDLNSV
ncbi:hypothetical protein HK102_009676, partial [Quaeritorhiza haematococci]